MTNAEGSDVLLRKDLEDLIFRTTPLRRFTQDSPILPDVWIAYGLEPAEPLDLLLTPNRVGRPGDVYGALREHLDSDEADTALAYSESTVAVCLTFEQLVRIVLPFSYWRHEHGKVTDGWLELGQLSDREAEGVARALVQFETGRTDESPTEKERPRPTSPSVLWTLRVVGTIELARQGRARQLRSQPKPGATIGDLLIPVSLDGARELVQAVRDLVAQSAAPDPLIFSVSRNRPAEVSVFRSMQSVKADAARRLFNVSCVGIRWAVIDSGVDAEHPAFRRRIIEEPKRRGPGRPPRTPPPPAAPRPAAEPFAIDASGRPVNNTRVLATYDFTSVRELLGLRRNRPVNDPDLADRLTALPGLRDELVETLERRQPVRWTRFAPLLEIAHAPGGAYRKPAHEHGTHVAGILAADWQRAYGTISGHEPPDHDLVGVCPDIEIYDLRVLGARGSGDEFAVMAALEFVRGLNTEGKHLTIHGVNLSMAIRHDVANYACGQTPICEEAERLVDTGATVVAAAGNDGYVRSAYDTTGGSEGYRSISITDPGNAEAVITVGATHGYRPHAYGVSYFSSRGPTGDGRAKPDLVAPGEKIWSAVPDGGVRTLDGTSMAAPHVSGCAALLMARHRELVGLPERIKEILYSTATDLGRERYFQGHGLVDVLRAMQAV